MTEKVEMTLGRSIISETKFQEVLDESVGQTQFVFLIYREGQKEQEIQLDVAGGANEGGIDIMRTSMSA